MANVKFEGNIPKEGEIVNKGDFVYCKSKEYKSDFWGIYDGSSLICLSNGVSSYIPSGSLRVGEIHNTWLIAKCIPCNKVELIIKEIEDQE
jgi:hypothetical protein